MPNPISDLNSGVPSLSVQTPYTPPPSLAPAPPPAPHYAPPQGLGASPAPPTFTLPQGLGTTRPPGALPPPGDGPNFNLQNLIGTFPGVNDSLALEQQGISQLDANLNAARQQAIIGFGDPALAGLAGFGLDPQAGAFAQQNYLSGNSTLARLDKQHKLGAQSVINQLVSHGLLNSGDLGYGEGQENQAYGNNVYDAQQSVLQQLAGLYNNYLTSRYGLESNANSAQLQALQSFLANPDAYATLLSGASTQPGAATAAPKVPKVPKPADAISRYLTNRAA